MAAAGATVPLRAADREPLDQTEAAREYLESENSRERQQCLSRLAGFSGDIDAVLKALRERVDPPVKPGYDPLLRFDSPRRREKYPRDLLDFVVPKDHNPTHLPGDPNMVDVSRPVEVRVDGKTQFSGRMRPSLAAALESCERRRDWGLIDPIRSPLGKGP